MIYDKDSFIAGMRRAAARAREHKCNFDDECLMTCEVLADKLDEEADSIKDCVTKIEGP